MLKGWIFEECLSMDNSVDTTEHAPVPKEVVVETDSSSEVMSLKDFMADSGESDPIILDHVEARSFSGERYEQKYRDDVVERLGLESKKEGLETLSAAFKIQASLNGTAEILDPAKTVIDLQHARIPSSVFLDSVFGKAYLQENVNFTCKKNVFNGPFGLCYF